MKEFIDITIFSLMCLLTPVVIALSACAIVEICNKLQPKINKLMRLN